MVVHLVESTVALRAANWVAMWVAQTAELTAEKMAAQSAANLDVLRVDN